jgi:predicted HTH transcriptional regulator
MTTENLAFHNVSSSGVSADQHSKVLALVKEFPYRTARELSNKVNPGVLTHDAIHKRLPELRQMGLVFNGLSRVCTITGKRAKTWTV